MHSLRGGRLHAIGYSDVNPKSAYEYLHGEVRYMDYSFGPAEIDEGPYLQVPRLSHRKTVTIATSEFLEDLLREDCPARKDFPKSCATDALGRYIIVSDWTDYSNMVFDGFRFTVGPWDDWV
jgi:hypothetical protein